MHRYRYYDAAAAGGFIFLTAAFSYDEDKSDRGMLRPPPSAEHFQKRIRLVATGEDQASASCGATASSTVLTAASNSSLVLALILSSIAFILLIIFSIGLRSELYAGRYFNTELHPVTISAKGMPVIGLRTDFRLCADSDGGLVNVMIQGSVLRMCRSVDEVLGVLVRLGRGTGKA